MGAGSGNDGLDAIAIAALDVIAALRYSARKNTLVAGSYGGGEHWA